MHNEKVDIPNDKFIVHFNFLSSKFFCFSHGLATDLWVWALETAQNLLSDWAIKFGFLVASLIKQADWANIFKTAIRFVKSSHSKQAHLGTLH